MQKAVGKKTHSFDLSPSTVIIEKKHENRKEPAYKYAWMYMYLCPPKN